MALNESMEPEWSGRPPARALGWALPTLAVSVPLIFALELYGGFGSSALTFAGVLLFALSLRTVLMVFRGRTSYGPDGVRNRLVSGERSIPWEDVQRVAVLPTPTGRRVSLRTPQRVVMLAAPAETLFHREPRFDDLVAELAARAGGVEVKRHGGRLRPLLPLLVVALVVTALVKEGPQHEPWWPGVRQAASVPDACALVDEATARRMLGDHMPAQGRASDCSWRQQQGFAQLNVSYRRYERGLETSASEEAGSRGFVELPEGAPVAGLGDEARSSMARLDEKALTFTVLARRANVVVKLSYVSDRPEEQAREDALALARRAVVGIAVE